MNYTDIIVGNLTNPTMDIKNLRYVCELDQISMMHQVAKTPIKAYYILLIAVIILLIYILIPKIKEYYSTDRMLFPVFVLSFASLFLYTFTTFNITKQIWDKYINPILTILFIIGIIFIIWKERKNIKGIINKLRKEQ